MNLMNLGTLISNEIKPHPHVTIEQAFNIIGKKNISNSMIRYGFNKFGSFWRQYTGTDMWDEKICNEFNMGLDAYRKDNWILKNLFYPEVSASFILEKTCENNYIRKTAQLICGAMKFWFAIKNENFFKEYEAGNLLDSSRYHNFFSRLTYSKVDEQGKVHHEISNSKTSKYIVVSIRSEYYAVKVIKENNILCSYKNIINQINAVVDHVLRAEKKGNGWQHLNILSTFANKKSITLSEKLIRNFTATRTIIDQALFHISIDIDDDDSDLERNFRTIHCKNYRNRDYRKSMQIVVTKGCYAGVIVNPHAGIGGTLSARFVSELYATCKELEQINIDFNRNLSHKKINVCHLPCTATLTSKQKKLVEYIEKQICNKIYPDHFPSLVEVCSRGSVFFKKFGLNPNGIFVALVHQAYYECFNKLPFVGNFINLRNIKHGDIWRYNATNQAMHEFAKYPSLDNLHRAVQSYRTHIKEQKNGTDEYFHGVSSMMRLVGERELSFKSVLPLLFFLKISISNFTEKFIDPHLWISQIPTYPGLAAAGRAMVTLDYIGKNHLAGHFLVFSESIQICLIGNSTKNLDRQTEFANILKDCFDRICDKIECSSKDY